MFVILCWILVFPTHSEGSPVCLYPIQLKNWIPCIFHTFCQMLNMDKERKGILW